MIDSSFPKRAQSFENTVCTSHFDYALSGNESTQLNEQKLVLKFKKNYFTAIEYIEKLLKTL